MRKVKYKIGKNENVGLIPYEAIIEAYIVHYHDGVALIYLPKKVKWKTKKESGIDSGCGCLWFAEYLSDKKYWVKSKIDYINLDKNNPYEKKIQSKRKPQCLSKKKSKH